MKKPLSQAPATEPLLNAREAAHALKLPLYYFTKPRARRAKRIPHIRIGQMLRFRLSALTNWFETQGGSNG